jgi:hypothetical protein
MATYTQIYAIKANAAFKSRVAVAIAKAATDILVEAIPSSTMLYDAASAQKVISVNNRYAFWLGKIVVVSDGSNSEEATIASITAGSGDTGNLTMVANLTHAYTVAAGGKVTFKDNAERIGWAKTSLRAAESNAEQMLWTVVQNPTIQTAGAEDATDSDIQFVVNSNINTFASIIAV